MIRKILITTFLLILTLGVSLVGFEAVYAEQLPPGIVIDGQGFAGQNRLAIQRALEKKYAEYYAQGLVLASTEKQYQMQLKDAGISFDIASAIERAYAIAHSTIPGYGALQTLAHLATKGGKIPVPVIVDQTQLDSFLDTVVYPTFSQQATEATLNIGDTVVEILPAKPGIWVEEEQFLHNLRSAAASRAQSVPVPTMQKQADIQAKDLAQAKEDAEILMKRDVVFVAGTKKITPQKSDLAKLVTIRTGEEGLRATVDSEKLKTYLLEKIAPKVEQRLADEVIDPNDGVIKAGRDGYKLKVDDSVTIVGDALAKPESKQTIKLAVEIKNKANITIDPQEGSSPGLAPGKYLEINLKKQRLYLYEGTTFVNSFRVSTGKWSTPTPEGTFAIHNKLETAYSRPYDLYMPKWNGLSGVGVRAAEYGIHGLPYKGKWVEGENHIGTPVSHGCIRLGKGNDQFVFSWADIGTTVIIHK